jgi:hypothetical protein
MNRAVSFTNLIRMNSPDVITIRLTLEVKNRGSLWLFSFLRLVRLGC